MAARTLPAVHTLVSHDFWQKTLIEHRVPVLRLDIRGDLLRSRGERQRRTQRVRQHFGLLQAVLGGQSGPGIGVNVARPGTLPPGVHHRDVELRHGLTELCEHAIVLKRSVEIALLVRRSGGYKIRHRWARKKHRQQ